MVNDRNDLDQTSRLPFLVGWSLTAIVVVVFLALLWWGETCGPDGTCTRGVDRVLELSPNELGDMIAGLASSLALIWIIVTVMIQSSELQVQNKTFIEQRMETSRIRQAQEDQIDVIRKQIEILQDEAKDRQSERSFEYINELIETIGGRVKNWTRPPVELLVNEHDGQVKQRNFHVFSANYRDTPNVDLLREVAIAADNLWSLGEIINQRSCLRYGEELQVFFDRFSDPVSSISSELSNLRSGKIERIRRLGFFEVDKSLSRLRLKHSGKHG